MFAVANYLQGPKLASATVDPSGVVTDPGQQLRLFANQNLTAVKKSQVTITPSTPFSVSSTGETVAVQFAERLNYATRYQVTVKKVTSIYQDQPQTFRYSFTTAKAQLYYLDRASTAGSQPDTIVRTGLSGSARTVVYSAPHIQQFVVFPEFLAVVTQNDDRSSSLSFVSTSGGPVEQVALPGTGTVDHLEGSSDGSTVGFVFTGNTPSGTYSNDLMMVDLTGTGVVQPVLGLNGQPLAVIDWHFLSGGTSFVAQSADDTLLLMDSTKPGTAVPLGQYAELGRSSPDGKTLVVGDVFGKMAYSLANGKQTRLPSLPVAGQESFGGDLELLGSGDARIQQVVVLDPNGGYQSYLVYEQGKTSRILYQTVNGKGSIAGFSVSPNGQYVAVNVVPDVATSVSDNYAVDPMSTSITTMFVDIATGSVVRGVTGFDESW